VRPAFLNLVMLAGLAFINLIPKVHIYLLNIESMYVDPAGFVPERWRRTAGFTEMGHA